MATSKKNKALMEDVRIILEKGLLLLPILSAMAYFASYAFERSYLSIYNVPSQLVQVKLEDFVLIFLALSFITAVVYMIYDEHKAGRVYNKSPFFWVLVVFLSLVS